MILLTGATGLVGSAVLRRLVGRGAAVRCLVRDPRRLGRERMGVQLAIGDLADPASHRNALRGVRTVVHLAGAGRDQPRATIEELDGLAVWRLLRAAERAGADRFVWLTPLGAGPLHPARLHRSRALAEAAVADAGLRTTTLASSLVYAPGDHRWQRLERFALLPAVPLAGAGGAMAQPIWAEDVADCVVGALDRDGDGHERLELAGPDVLSQREIVALVLRAQRRRRRTVALPPAVLRRALRVHEAVAGPAALVTWDEVEPLTVSSLTSRGTADAEALGVRPRPMPDVFAVR